VFVFTAEKEQMAWRLGAHTVRPLVLGRRLAAGLVVLTTAVTSAWGVEPEGASVRVATFQGDDVAGEGFFAASIQPAPEKSLLDAVTRAGADVAIVVDTSASQAGGYRDDSMAALQGILGQLREGDRVRIYAADVRAADLSAAFHAKGSSATNAAVGKL